MSEYTYSITDNTKRRAEDAEAVAAYSNWYDNTDKENRLDEAISLGYIESIADDDRYFLETVLDEARRLNHGPEWIKEIMDREREFDNPHLDISQDAEEQKATVETVIEAYKMHISIRDWCVGAKPTVETPE